MLKPIGLYAALAAMVFVGPLVRDARAATIILAPDTDDQEFSILWSQIESGVDLTALAQFSVDVTDTFADFTITLTNNTTDVSEKVHSFGFNVDPNATGIQNVDTGTFFQNIDLNQHFPGGFGTLDVCVWGTQNCEGGGSPSNLPGGGVSDTVAFRLLGDFSSGLTLTTFAIKFQGDIGSFEFEGEEPPPPPSVPEPASVLLLGIGAAGTLTSRRYSRRITARD